LTGQVLDLAIDGVRARAKLQEIIGGVPYAREWFTGATTTAGATCRRTIPSGATPKRSTRAVSSYAIVLSTTHWRRRWVRSGAVGSGRFALP